MSDIGTWPGGIRMRAVLIMPSCRDRMGAFEIKLNWLRQSMTSGALSKSQWSSEAAKEMEERYATCLMSWAEVSPSPPLRVGSRACNI